MEFQIYDNKPIVTIEPTGIECLLDTGAEVPVWTQDVDSLRLFAPSAKYVKNIDVYGFTGSKSVEVYRLPMFRVADSTSGFTFTGLHVAIVPMDADYKLILGYSMIRSMGITFNGDKISSNLTAAVPVTTPIFSSVHFGILTAPDCCNRAVLRSVIDLSEDLDLKTLLKSAGYNNQLSTFLYVFPDVNTNLSNAQILDKFKETIPQPTPYARGEII